MNKVILLGRLTKDVELRQTQQGVSVCRFSIAVNRRFAKEGQMNADFINCTAWRNTADFIAKYFHKGNMIAVVGSLNTSSWEGQDGKKQYSTDVLVDEAYFTGSKENSSSSAPQDSFGGFDGFKEMDATGDSFPWEN